MVPCHTKRETRDALRRLLDTVQRIGRRLEVIPVDDGSATLRRSGQEVARWLTCDGVRHHRAVTQLRHESGADHGDRWGSTRRCGRHARCRSSSTSPELIPELLQKWREGADTVYAAVARPGRRGIAGGSGPRLLAPVNAADRFRSATRCGRLPPMDRLVVDAPRTARARNRFEGALYATFSTASVPHTGARAHATAVQPVTQLWLALDGLTASRPGRCA